MITGKLKRKKKGFFCLKPEETIVFINGESYFCKWRQGQMYFYEIYNCNDELIVFSKIIELNWLKEFLGCSQISFFRNNGEEICRFVSDGFFKGFYISIYGTKCYFSPPNLGMILHPEIIEIHNVRFVLSNKIDESYFEILDDNENFILPSIGILYYFWNKIWMI